MHILEIPSFFPPYGGMFCLDQARAMHDLGHEVRILSNVQLGLSIGFTDYITLPYGRHEKVMEGITVCQSYQRGLPKNIRRNVNRWLSIVQSMYGDYVKRYGRPDILHAHCAKWAGYAAMQISKAHVIPYVITEHLSQKLLEQEFGKSPSSAWQIPLLRQAYENADMVITVSEELVGDTACYYGSDYRWQYVTNTIDTKFFSYMPREAREGRPFRFCCLADYSFLKGYDVLFDAYKILQQQGVKTELHIAGTNTDGSSCRKEIQRRGINGVEAYGRIDRQHVRDLLYHSDALVLASRSEVQPLVLLEAMSTGIPVISTECIPRCLRLEGGCTIVPVGNAAELATVMNKVMAADVNGSMLSQQIVEMASPQAVGRKLEQIFSEILNRNNNIR